MRQPTFLGKPGRVLNGDRYSFCRARCGFDFQKGSMVPVHPAYIQMPWGARRGIEICKEERGGRDTEGARGKLESVSLFKVVQAQNNFFKSLSDQTNTNLWADRGDSVRNVFEEHVAGSLGGGA